jgi:hypothetical protein
MKLASKYKVPSPLDDLQPTYSSGGGAPALSSGLGRTGLAPSPFGSGPSASFMLPNQSESSSPFTSGPNPTNLSSALRLQPTTNPSGFGISSPSPFGHSIGAMTQSSPFGQGSGGITHPSPFASPPAATPPGSNSQMKFQGRNPREMLLSFYQQKNPSKLAEVDKLLEKYRGSEEQMFRNLAKKYQLDPSVFGLSANPVGSFGVPAVGSSPAFGQRSLLGSGQGLVGSPSPFGQGGGFGHAAPLGSSGAAMGTPGGGTPFGSSVSAAFGSSSFGTLAHSSTLSPFGAQSSGFGTPSVGFGAAAGSFGSATPFGAPRR